MNIVLQSAIVAAGAFAVIGAVLFTGEAPQTALPTGDETLPSPYEGEWAGSLEGAGTVHIERQDAGDYLATVEVAHAGCTGGISGRASVVDDGARLLLSKPNVGGGVCRITFEPVEGGLRLEETNCMEWHGMACGFSGTVQRSGVPVS